MPVKSIVEVELAGAEKFERFQALYAKYEAALLKQPAAWKKASGAMGETGQQLQKMTAALLAQNQLHHDIAGEEKKQNEALGKSQRLWSSIGDKVKSVASTVGHITLSLLKWGAILGGAGGAFSLYGIGRAIEGVTEGRRSAMGLGLSIGQQTSFGINFSRLLDTGQYLSFIAGMEQDVTKQAPFYSLTGGAPTGNTEADAMRMLMAMRRLARTTPLGMLGPEFSAFGLNMSQEDIRRLAGMGNTEFQQLIAGNRSDIAKTNVSDRLAKGWQDLLTQMQLAGKQIEKTFVIGLAPLQGPLTRLSGSIVHVLEVAMRKNGLIEQGITSLSKWLDTFNGKIAKPQFLKDVESFTSNVGALAGGIKWIVDRINFLEHPGHAVATAVKDVLHPGISPYSMLSGGPGITSGSRSGYIGGSGRYGATADKLDAIFGFSAGTMRRLVQTESGFNPNLTSPKGAQGLGQLMPDTAWSYGLRGGDVFNPIKNLTVSAEYLSSLVRRFGGNMEQALAAYNWGPTNVQRDISQFGSKWFAHLPRETREYVVKIENATGGSAVVASAGLGSP